MQYAGYGGEGCGNEAKITEKPHVKMSKSKEMLQLFFLLWFWLVGHSSSLGQSHMHSPWREDMTQKWLSSGHEIRKHQYFAEAL